MTKEVAAVTVRLDARVARLEAGMKRARRVTDRVLGSIDRQVERTNRRISNMGGGLSGAARARLGNVGNQLQDVIVQAQMGTDAFRILGQQGPQLAGAFGPFGAVIGTVVAGLAVLAPMMFQTEEKSIDLGKAVDSLSQTLQRYEAFARTASASNEQLARTYKENIDVVREWARDGQKLAVGAALRGSQDVATAMLQQFEVLGRVPLEAFANLDPEIEIARQALQLYHEEADEARRNTEAFRTKVGKLRRVLADLNAVSGEIQRLADLFGISVPDANRQAVAMRKLMEAGDGEMTNRLAEARSLLTEIHESTEDVTREFDAFAKGVLEADDVVRKTRAAVAEAEAQTAQLATAAELISFQGAVQGANALSAALGKAVSLAAELAGAGVEDVTRARLKMRFTGNPVGEARALAEHKFDSRLRSGGVDLSALPDGAREAILRDRRSSVANAEKVARLGLRRRARLEEIRAANRGGGGGGGGSAASAYDRLIEKSNLRLEKLREEILLTGQNDDASAKLAARFDKERLVRELVAAAQREGKTLTEEQLAQAVALADAIEKETVALARKEQVVEAAAEATRKAADMQRDLAAGVQSVADTLIDAVLEADSFSEALKRVGLEFARLVAQGLFSQGRLGGVLGGLLESVFSAKGNVFEGGNVVPFARGGVVSAPTAIPMPRGIGLMGEAGPQAILPLKRGRGGRLGVEASGRGGTTVNVYAHYDPGVNASTRAMISQENQKLKAEILRAVPGAAAHGFSARPASRR